MMLFLIWLIILSVVQDYVWVLLGVPGNAISAPSTTAGESVEKVESKNEENKPSSTSVVEDEDDEKSTAIETEVVAEEDGGDDI